MARADAMSCGADSTSRILVGACLAHSQSLTTAKARSGRSTELDAGIQDVSLFTPFFGLVPNWISHSRSADETADDAVAPANGIPGG